MPRSIIGWFTLCWGAFLLAAVIVGGLLVSLYRQTTAEQVRHAAAAVAHGCDLIAGRYDFLLAGTRQAPDLADRSLRVGLVRAVGVALRGESGVEGGIWSVPVGSLAYAFPTYQGTGPKTDLPQAELPSIRAVAQAAAQDGAPVRRSWRSGTQVLLLYACPLSGPIPQAAAWTMARVETAGGQAFLLAVAGLGVLLLLLLGSAAWLWPKLRDWSRLLARVEAELAEGGGESLPHLERTGQRDLDRIVAALNAARARLQDARARADRLAAEVTRAERLAALGRVAAGVAHEVRNPIAAMRLKAENALADGAAATRKDSALRLILDQIARLDRLTRDLLQSVHGGAIRRRTVTDLPSFLTARLDLFRDEAARRGISLFLAQDCPPEAEFDPDRMGQAIDNQLLNAVQNTGPGGRVELSAQLHGDTLSIAVRDNGPGVPTELRDTLFEPFVTGRRQGTGLGLAIVREAAEAHGGSVRVEHLPDGSKFVIEVPAWRAS